MWFRQRSYGWGWFPIKIEGWISVILFVIGIIYFSTRNVLGIFVLIAMLILLGYLKGPKPRWSWGRNKK